MFHSQNHAVVHSESMTGQEITAENTANAPLEMRIYGASRQEQSTQGKNLLDPYRLLPSNAATTIAIDDNVITVTSTWYASIVVNVEKNSSYTIQCGITGSANTVPLRVTDTAETGRLAVLTETVQTATFNTAELEQVKVWLYSGNGTEQTATFTNLQLEEGIIGTAYETFTPNSPSPDYPSEIKSAVDFEVGSEGMNLWRAQSGYLPKVINGVSIEYRDGCYILNGIASVGDLDIWNTVNNRDITDTALKAGEQVTAYYTVDGGTMTGTMCRLAAGVQREDGGIDWSIRSGDNGTPATRTIPSSGKLRRIRFYTAAGTVFNGYCIRPQLQRGPATEYMPYMPSSTATIDQVLRGIPDGSGGWAARDYIEVKDGIVRLVRECGEIAFDGTEVWFDYIANFGAVSYNLPHKPSTPILCTHGRNDRKADGGFVGWSSAAAIGFYPERAGVDSVAGWKAWLVAQNTAGSPIKVVYALDVAQVTDITSTELGQALSGMKSVQYYTRIYHTSALPVEMEVTILKLGR